MITLKEIFLLEDDLVASLQNPSSYWELGQDGKELLQAYMEKNKERYFRFEPSTNNKSSGYYNFSRKVGSEHDRRSGKLLPISAKLLALNIEDKEFQIATNLQDPRVYSIISSTINMFPGFSDFSVVKFIYDNNTDEWEKINFGRVDNLMSKSKRISGKSSAYGEDRYESFELIVFKELSEDNWYHATTKTNLDSIRKDGLIKPSGDKQGKGWTEFNLNLQKAVYLTKSKRYAYQIAETLASRFEQSACVLEIDGSILKTNGYANIVVDEDSLRDDYDGSVSYFRQDEDFLDLTKRMPEFFSSVTDKIESIGYKGNISTKYIIDIDIIDYEKTEEDW